MSDQSSPHVRTCERCKCCTVSLCAAAVVNRKSCVDYALSATVEMEEQAAACPCAPRGVTYAPFQTDNVIPFPQPAEDVNR